MKKTLVRVLACTLILPASGGVALAQSDGEVALEEILVTATRREEALMEVDLSIQAIPAAVLELPTFNDLTDITTLVPGAVAFSNKPPNKEGVQFRNSGIIQSGADDGQAPVGYYVDDIPYVDISTPVPPPIGTFDLERIEIIRGPQGTSYGQDSSAGSIILRTSPVDLEDFGYKLRAGYSQTEGTSDAGYTIGGVLNIPIAEDVFGVRISYLREEDAGYGAVAGRPDIDDPLANSRDSMRIKAFWAVSENFDLEFTHSEWNTDYNTLPATQIQDTSGGGMLLNEVSTPMLLALFPDGRLQNKFEIRWTTLRARFDLDFAELIYSAGRVDTPKKETNSEFGFDIGLGPQFSAVVFNQPAESTTHELRLVSTSDSKLQWLGGLFFLDAESNSAGWTDTPDFFFREEVSDPIDAEAMAIYGEIDYAFTDTFSASFGLRYHDEERTYTSIYSSTEFFPNFTYFSDPLFGPQSDALPTTMEDSSFDHVSYRLSLNWNPSENGLVYFTHSTANRAPVIQPQSNRIQLENAGIQPPGDADAAELVNTEIGTKWTLADGKVQLEAAYVFGDWKDMPMWATLNIPPQPLSLTIGGTDAEATTLEFSLLWAVNDNLTLNYAGAFADTEVQKIPADAAVTGYPPAVVVGGDLFNYSPATHNFGLNFNHELGGSDWDMFGSLNYVTRDKPDGINVFDLFATEYVPARDEYRNLAINLGARKGPWSFTFAIDNATDEDGMFGPSTAIATDGFILAPRTYSLQVIYDGME